MRTLPRVMAAMALFSLASAVMAADQIDNPEYTQWSKYKTGTYVTLQQTMEMPSMPQMATMMPQTKITTKLTEVKPDKLTLEVTTTQTTNGQSRDTKSTRTIPAKIDKPATTMPEGVKGEVKDLKEGKETVEVKGTKVDTTTREFTTTATSGPGATATESHMKVWNSTEVPGGMVKTETASKTEMGDMKMTMTVVDYSVAK